MTNNKSVAKNPGLPQNKK